MDFILPFFFSLAVYSSSARVGNEPECLNNDFVERLHEKLVRIEHGMDLLVQKMVPGDKTDKESNKLEEKLTRLGEEFKILKNNVAEQQENIDDAKRRNEAMFKRMSANIQLSNRTIENIEKSGKHDIHFRVKTVPKAPAVGQVIVFSNVLLNDGNGYHRNGIFTVPMEGMYLFTAQVCTQTDTWIGYQIVAAGEPIAASGHHDEESSGTCSMTQATVYLKKNSNVYVRCTWYNGKQLYEHSDYSWNMFTGLIL